MRKSTVWKLWAAALGTAAVLGACGNGETAVSTEVQTTAGAEVSQESAETEGTSEEAATEGESVRPVPSGKPLIVGTQPNHVGIPVHRAEVAGYFEDAGLDVQIEVFATGAPINEAMAAESLDVAVSGMASVYNLATGRYTYIGDGTITNGGDGIYARPDSPIALAEKDERGLVTDPELLRGVQILGPLAGVSHYQAVKYMEAVGLTAEDFSMVAMDYAQAYQAFIAGEGDLIACTVPYSTQLEAAGYVKVCDTSTISDKPIIDTVYIQNDAAQERRDDIELFLECYYKACADLMEDPEMRRELSLKWYTDEGINTSEEDIEREMEVKSYYSLEEINPDDIGWFMVDLGEFYVSQGLVEEEDIPNIQNSIDPSFIRDVQQWALTD